MYDIKWIGEIMNKNKIGIAVLLLGLSLGPVQTSQNYTIRLNNLVYAEDGANQPTTGEGSVQNVPTTPSTGTETTGNQGNQEGNNTQVQPLKETAPTTKVKEAVKAEVEKFNSEVEASNVYKLATEKEKKAYKEAYDAIVKDIEKEVKEDGKAEDYIAAYKKALLKDSMELGYTVVKNIHNRIKLRNLKADLSQLEEAAKTAKLELPADLKTLAESADKILAEKDHETDEIEENVKAFSNAIDKFKNDNKLTIKESKLSDEEAKYGYPDDVYKKGMGETKDLSEVRLDAKIFLEATNSDDTKIEKRLGDLYKKDSLTDKEEKEKKNLEAYKSSKSNLENNLYNLDVSVENLKSYLDAYVVATSKVIINAEPAIDQKTIDDFAKRLKAIRDSHKDFIASDKFKKADEKLRKTYEDAYKALDGTTEYSLDAKSKIEAVEKAKRDIEKVEEDVLISKIATALNVDKNKEFTESENFRRAPKKLKEAYKKAFEDLGKKKTEENLKAFEEAKKAIEDKDFAGEFNDKLKALEKYIDQAKSDNLTEDSLKKLKKEYADKLKDLKDNKDANVDDLKALEDDFNKDLNPEKPEKGSNKAKTTKRVVSTKKNAGGKVRTGVESVLPLAGGVLVVAAIALVLTRKKNK